MSKGSLIAIKAPETGLLLEIDQIVKAFGLIKAQGRTLNGRSKFRITYDNGKFFLSNKYYYSRETFLQM